MHAVHAVEVNVPSGKMRRVIVLSGKLLFVVVAVIVEVPMLGQTERNPVLWLGVFPDYQRLVDAGGDKHALGEVKVHAHDLVAVAFVAAEPNNPAPSNEGSTR